MPLISKEPKSIKLWSQDVRAVFLGDNLVWGADFWEKIIYKMNADSSWNLYIPTAWYSTSWSQNASYSWKVSIDWWPSSTYSWTSSYWGSITITWYTAWTNHTITIRPTSETYWWARAYCWYNTAWKSYLTDIVYDSSYIWYADSDTNTWICFRYFQYSWCSTITSCPDEVLPDTVTVIGEKFRWYQYYWCTSLLFAPIELLNDNTTSIWRYFRAEQYNYCSALNEVKWWKDLSIGGTYYRQNQFSIATTPKVVTVLSDVWYSSYNDLSLPNAYTTTVYVPTAYLNNYKNSTINPRQYITDSKFVWY